MKKIIVVFIFFFASNAAYAGIGVSFGVGSGWGGQNKNITGTVSLLGEVKSIGLLLGMDVFTDFKSGFLNNVHDYNIPHGDYHTYSKDKGELGLSFLAGYKFNKYFGLLGGIGVGLTGTENIAVSNATGWEYRNGGKTKAGVEFSAQGLFQYKYLVIHGGYSFRRGVMINIGIMIP